MTIELRLLLFLGALFTTIYIGFEVKKGRIDIEHSLFWVLFSFGLVILSIFPKIVIFFSSIVGIQSPTNFLFLVMIFVLFIKDFSMSKSFSKIEKKNKELTQKIALEKKSEAEKRNKEF
ncbi:hypothetical protein NRIC_18100 [Enterococcus florum]|uniref:DUF2304 domain-containing protein n=1 Tax=Enterococcus florum TaxID=2480627 RepID=A0A4V0WPH9_9ENTE|nr:hypothetical protein NRIC_18100 [Enterococcus florum]